MSNKKGPFALGLSSALCLGLGFAAPVGASPPPNEEKPAETKTQKVDPEKDQRSMREHKDAAHDKSMRGHEKMNERANAPTRSHKGSFAKLGADQTKEIQRALKNEGHYDGKIDGIAGPKTRQAVRAFQQAEQVMVSGNVDAQTASLLGVDIRTNTTNDIQRVSGSQAPATERTPGTSARFDGDRSVRQVQQKLQDEGYYDDGTVDGLMGPKTMAALQAYQRENGLKATGKIDNETKKKLGVSTVSASEAELLDFESAPDVEDAPTSDRPMDESLNRREVRDGHSANDLR